MGLQGIDTLKGQLRLLKSNLGQPLVRRIARKGAQIARTQARQNLPGNWAKLKRGVVQQERRSTSPSEAIFNVGVKRQKGARFFTLKFLERSARAHTVDVHGTQLARPTKHDPMASRAVAVNPRKGRGKRTLKTKAGQFLGPSVRHPGLSAKPWLQPALAQSRPAITQEANLQVQIAIERAKTLGVLPDDGGPGE